MRIEKSSAQKRISFVQSGENLYLLEKLQAYFILHKNQHMSKEALVRHIYEQGLAQVLQEENLTAKQLLDNFPPPSE